MNEPPERNPPVARSYLALRDVAAVVDHVLARRGVARVSLVGWSWGGTLAGWYASLRPERVRTLVLYAPIYEGRGKPQPLGPPRAWITFPAAPAVVQERYARVYPLPAGEPPRDAALLEALSRELLASDPTSTSRDPASYRVPAGAGVDLHLIRNGQLLFHASSIQAPTLVVLGAADTVVGPSHAEALLRDLTGAPVARALILPGLTHIAQFDPRREQLFTVVEWFLREPARASRPGDPPGLPGRWVLQDGTGHLLQLRAGGTGTFRGEPLTWTVDGPRLTMVDASGSDTTGWRIEGDRLVLTGPFETEIVLAREPGGARPPASR
jgi:pimeloyl-ACP methyl ester carboxylesterase